MVEWSNQNHPAHLRVMNRRSWLTGTRGKTSIQRSTEAINLEINQAQSLKPRLTSRAGALTQKAILLTLDQEHPTNLPEQWRNWSDTLEKHTMTASSHPSWLKLLPLYPTQRWQPSLIWAPSAQKQMERWPTSKKNIDEAIRQNLLLSSGTHSRYLSGSCSPVLRLIFRT